MRLRAGEGVMRLYRAWLHWYPASFRAEYGEEMCTIFARKQRDADGPVARLASFIAAFAEVLGNAAAVHLDILGQDLRVTARALRRAPSFALTAIIVLALGIGANTAAFSITDHVLIRPLPFPDPGRLVKLWETVPGYNRMELSPPNYRDWKQMSTSFAGMAAVAGFSVNLVGSGEPVRVEGAVVTAELFSVLGVHPAWGSDFTAADNQESAPGTVVLSDRFWRAGFGGDPGVLGRTVRLDDRFTLSSGLCRPAFTFQLVRRNSGLRCASRRGTTRTAPTTFCSLSPGSNPGCRSPPRAPK